MGVVGTCPFKQPTPPSPIASFFNPTLPSFEYICQGGFSPLLFFLMLQPPRTKRAGEISEQELPNFFLNKCCFDKKKFFLLKMYGKRDSLAPPRNKHSPLGCSSPTCESNMSYTVPPTVPKRRWQNVFSSGRKEGASSSPLLFTTLCTMAHAAGNGQKNQRSNAPILVKCLHVLVRQTARNKRTGSRIESHPICQRGESHPSEAGRPWQLSRRHAPTLPYVTSLHAIPPFPPPPFNKSLFLHPACCVAAVGKGSYRWTDGRK